MEDRLKAAMERLIVRKDHLACTKCGAVEPIHPGDGTPAATFIAALSIAALRHVDCDPMARRTR